MSDILPEVSLRTTLDEIIEGIQIISRDWRYLYVNKAVAQQGRKTPSELLGKSMEECYPGIENSSVFSDFRYVMQQRVPKRLENEFTYEDGQRKWFELFIQPHTEGILIRSIDISERKKFEEKLWHAQKMEAVGRLASGIAHDFNNKLGIILAHTQLALGNIEGTETPVKPHLEKVTKVIQQSSELTKQLLAFGQKQLLNPKITNLNNVIGDFVEKLHKILPEEVKLQFQSASDLKSVFIDPNRFEQVVLNLCTNASDAMPNGGLITIQTANVTLDEIFTRTHPEVIPGLYVMLSVSDTGRGIPKADHAKIFEPFFTTKPRHKGGGLGLSMVHGIVKQSDGHIWLSSELNEGTTFKIYFPTKINSVEDDVDSTPKLITNIHGTETVLLTEDDEELRRAYKETIEKFGYKVFEAADASSAIEVFKKAKSKIDILVTDVIMPGINGFQLADELQNLKPDLKTLFISGYAEKSHYQELQRKKGFVLLQKPILMKDLIETLRHVLDQSIIKPIK